MARYVQKGSTIDYKNGGTAAIAAGDIVNLTSRIGVAGGNIAVGAVGAVAVSGVYAMPKASGAVTLGAVLYFDPEADKITTAASTGESSSKKDNVPAGWAVAAAGESDAEVLVKIG